MQKSKSAPLRVAFFFFFLDRAYHFTNTMPHGSASYPNLFFFSFFFSLLPAKQEKSKNTPKYYSFRKLAAGEGKCKIKSKLKKKKRNVCSMYDMINQIVQITYQHSII